MRLIGWILGPLTLVAGLPAFAQSAALTQAIRAGQVGERFDGYMGFVSAPSPEVRRQVLAINIRRRNLYLELAGRRNVTAEVVGIATACQLLRQLAPGEAYLLADNMWRRRAPGEPAPVPQQCG